MNVIRATVLSCLTVVIGIVMILYYFHSQERFEVVHGRDGVFVFDRKTSSMNYCDDKRCVLISDRLLINEIRTACAYGVQPTGTIVLQQPQQQFQQPVMMPVAPQPMPQAQPIMVPPSMPQAVQAAQPVMMPQSALPQRFMSAEPLVPQRVPGDIDRPDARSLSSKGFPRGGDDEGSDDEEGPGGGNEDESGGGGDESGGGESGDDEE